MTIQGKIRSAIFVGFLGSMLAMTSTAFSQQAPPDNTRNNQQDRSDDRPTADQQSNNAADQNLTRQIRQAISSDKSLSTYAHNVKVISQDGQVTLRGPVRSKEEKRVVEAKAAEIAGDGKVTSELQVEPQK